MAANPCVLRVLLWDLELAPTPMAWMPCTTLLRKITRLNLPKWNLVLRLNNSVFIVILEVQGVGVVGAVL